MSKQLAAANAPLHPPAKARGLAAQEDKTDRCQGSS